MTHVVLTVLTEAAAVLAEGLRNGILSGIPPDRPRIAGDVLRAIDDRLDVK